MAGTIEYKMTLSPSRRLLLCTTVGIILFWPLINLTPWAAQGTGQRYTLVETIEAALKANLEFQRSKEDSMRPGQSKNLA